MFRMRPGLRQLTAKTWLLMVAAVIVACLGASCGVALLLDEPLAAPVTNSQPDRRTFADRAARGMAQLGDWLQRPRVPRRFIVRVQRALQRLWERVAPEAGTDRSADIAGRLTTGGLCASF